MNGNSNLGNWRKILTIVSVSACVLLTIGCRGTTSDSGTSLNDSMSVTAPSAGKVERLLVREGVRVNAGAPMIELIGDTIGAPTNTPVNNPEAIAVDSVKSADREVEAARSEVVRNEANVQRLTPLVTSGQASQAELDGARAQYDQSQQRLQRAQDAAQTARTDLNQARQPGSKPTAPESIVNTKVISVRAPAAGTVTIIGVRVGDQVVAGQTIATIRPD